MLESRLLRCSTISLPKQESYTIYQHFHFLSSCQRISASTLCLKPRVWPGGTTSHPRPSAFVVIPDSAEAKAKMSTRSIVGCPWHQHRLVGQRESPINSTTLHIFTTGNRHYATHLTSTSGTPESATVLTESSVLCTPVA